MGVRKASASGRRQLGGKRGVAARRRWRGSQKTKSDASLRGVTQMKSAAVVFSSHRGCLPRRTIAHLPRYAGAACRLLWRMFSISSSAAAVAASLRAYRHDTRGQRENMAQQQIAKAAARGGGDELASAAKTLILAWPASGWARRRRRAAACLYCLLSRRRSLICCLRGDGNIITPLAGSCAARGIAYIGISRIKTA